MRSPAKNFSGWPSRYFQGRLIRVKEAADADIYTVPMKASGNELDLRALLASGQSPFPIIEERVHGLAPGDSFDLLAPFEPVPLYDHLRAWGAAHTTVSEGSVFRITITKMADPAVPRYLDLRQAPPPEPFIRTTDALAELAPGHCLIVHLPHRPTPLLEHLEAQGIIWEEQEQPDGSCQLYLMKADDCPCR